MNPEPIALRCPSCAAAVAREDSRCAHCGSQLATVACPKCFAMVPFGESHCGHCGTQTSRETQGPAGPCPECKEPLERTMLGGVAVEQCLACGGLWMARPSFEHLCGDRETRAALVGYLPPADLAGRSEAVRYRPCPACRQFMNRTNYGRISGVVVDVCKADGVWFDRDELRRVLEFIQAGGMEKSRDRQIRDLKEAERQLAHAARQEHPAMAPMSAQSSGGIGFDLAEVAVEIVLGSIGSMLDG